MNKRGVSLRKEKKSCSCDCAFHFFFSVIKMTHEASVCKVRVRVASAPLRPRSKRWCLCLNIKGRTLAAIFIALGWSILVVYWIYGMFWGGPPRHERANAIAANTHAKLPVMSDEAHAAAIGYIASRSGWSKEHADMSMGEWFVLMPTRVFDAFYEWWYGAQMDHPHNHHKSAIISGTTTSKLDVRLPNAPFAQQEYASSASYADMYAQQMQRYAKSV